jgi:ATP-dependent Clp protease ATP-binding subunit ClpB
MSELSLDKFSQEAKSLILEAQEMADDRNHKKADPIHLITVSLRKPSVVKVFTDAGISTEDVSIYMEEFLLAAETAQEKSSLSLGMLNLLKRAEKACKDDGRKLVSLEHLIDSFTYEIDPKGSTLKFLETFGILPGDLKKHFVSSKITAQNSIGTPYLTNLTSLAKENFLDPIIGRNVEVRRMIQILGRRQKNHPILVGDSGVGKRSIVSALAQKIASGNVSSKFLGLNVITLDASKLTSGVKQRGEVEERMKKALRYQRN